jgi:hypothetical protein
MVDSGLHYTVPNTKTYALRLSACYTRRKGLTDRYHTIRKGKSQVLF